MSNASINFRGLADGILIEVKSGEMKDVIGKIEEKIERNRNFFKGANIVGIESESLEKIEEIEIIFLLKYKYGFNVSEEVINEILFDEEEEIRNRKLVEAEKILDQSDNMTKIVNKTIRSGQHIDYDGNVVIIGDVNPGAIIEAGGSIIVLGSFRGVGYAGKKGDKSAFIASYKLFPIQLGIAGMIARSSDEKEDIFTGLPEIAKIVDNKLVIEPYLPNK